MSLENAMASGYSPEREPEADYACPRCNYGLNPDDRVYEWDGNWLCGDCYKDAILSISDKDRAEMSCESIAHTEQMLGAYGFEPSATADVLHTETATAEDVL